MAIWHQLTRIDVAQGPNGLPLEVRWEDYSYRSATTGSTRMARRDGR
jgi:hypothetical protein